MEDERRCNFSKVLFQTPYRWHCCFFHSFLNPKDKIFREVYFCSKGNVDKLLLSLRFPPLHPLHELLAQGFSLFMSPSQYSEEDMVSGHRGGVFEANGRVD